MQRLIFLLILLFLFVHSESIQQTKRKVYSKKIEENFNKDDEVDDESDVFSTYADNRYAPADSLTTTPSTMTRTRLTTLSPVIVREDTNDHIERARFMAASTPSCYSVVDMNHPLLADTCGVLPQARYTLPNLFGHRERWQIELFLHGLISATTDNTCLRSLRLLLCPLLFPPCPSRVDMPSTSSTLFPCQSFCRAVKTHCSIPALDFLPCETLPLSSDLCPTNQVYATLFSQLSMSTPIVRFKTSRPLQVPMQDASSWNHRNTRPSIHHDQSTIHPLDYSSFSQETPMSISVPMGTQHTFFSE